MNFHFNLPSTSGEVEFHERYEEVANKMILNKDIDISSLQKKLDEQGLKILDAQKQSSLERKEVANKTKGRV